MIARMARFADRGKKAAGNLIRQILSWAQGNSKDWKSRIASIPRSLFGRFREMSTPSKIAICALPAAFLITVLTLMRTTSGQILVGNEAKQGPLPRTYDDSTLQIVQATPSGDISIGDLKKEIAVVFNHPVVPLAKLDTETKGVFTIQPKIPGQYRWYGSRVCAFVPKSAFTAGTTYRVEVPGGTRALNGKALAKTYGFEFRTPTLEVIEHSLLGSDYRYYYTRRIEYDQAFKLVFNFPVSLDILRKHLTITGKRSYAYRLSRPERPSQEFLTHPSNDSDHERVVQITPADRFGKDEEVRITISKNLKPTGGNRGMARDAVYTYRTYGPLEATLEGGVPKYFQDLWDYSIRFNNPVKNADIARLITFSPKAVYRGQTEGTSIFVRFSSWKLRPLEKYRVTISRNLNDSFGNSFRGEKSFQITLPPYRPSFHAESGHWSIEALMSQKLPVDITNLASVRVRAAPFSIEQVGKAIASHKYSILASTSGIKELNWNTGVSPSEAQRLGFDFSSYLDANKRGWIALQFSAVTPNYYNKPTETTYTQYIQSTDLGMTVKQGDTSSLVWVHSLTGGSPLKGVKVTAYDADKAIASGVTDSDGLCSLDTGALTKSYRSIFVAEKPSAVRDRAFVTATNHGVYMASLADYVESASAPHAGGEILFDRKLYRPGDEVRFKAVAALRRSGALAPFTPSEGTLKITVANSKGVTIFSKDYTPTDEGGADGALTLPADSPLGHYNIKAAAINRADKIIEGDISDTFQVEEFRPAAFSVETKGLRDAGVNQALDLLITGKYLFGAPMQSVRAVCTARRRAKALFVERFPEYFFGDEVLLESRQGTYDYYANYEGKTDLAGTLSWKVPLGPMRGTETDGLTISSPYDMEIEAKIIDVDDKSVTNTASCTVHAGNSIIGINPEDAYRNYRTPFTFNLVALDNGGNSAGPTEADLIIHREEIKSIQSQGPGGSRQAENIRTAKTVHESSMVLSGAPKKFTFTPGSPGSYILTVKERNGLAASRVRFYAFGGDFGGWGLYDEDVVKLIPDKTEYRPGDTARVLVQTPFPRARAIVTLERENVIWQKTMMLESDGKPISVPIKAEYLPNVYLSVMLITGRASGPASESERKKFFTDDLGAPRFKIGVVNLRVDNASKRARLEITTDREQYAPGDDVAVSITSEPHAEIALSVADRGVLDLVNYQFPDPIASLYRSWPLGVRAIENRRNLIPQLKYALKGNAPGGGDGDADAGFGGFHFDSEDGTRKDFRYTAFWGPRIKADGSGKASVRFTLPHNLTTFRVMALASAKGKYASAKKEFQVRRSVVVQPLMPRFIRPGDSLEVGTVVSNQTGFDADFDVSVKAPLLSFTGAATGEAKRTVRVPAGGAREVSFEVSLNVAAYGRARDDIKLRGPVEVKGTISCRAARGGRDDAKDSMTFSFPVLPHPPREAFTVAGFTDGKESEGIVIPESGEVLGGLGSLDIALSSTALTGLRNAFEFYATNPYFCLEQRASAYIAAISSGPLLEKFGYRAPSKKGYDFSAIKEIFLDDLHSFQNDDGGFNFWKGATPPRSDPYLTAYVSFVLQRAREHGHAFDRAIFNRALDYLVRYVQRPGKEYFHNTLENFSLIYQVLAGEGRNVGNLERFLLQNEKSLSLRAKGNLALGIADSRRVSRFDADADTKRLVEHFKNRMEIGTRSVSFREDSTITGGSAYYSGASTMGVLLRAFIKLEPKNPMIPKMVRYAVEDKSHRLWNESHGVGNLACALLAYSKRFESPGADFTGRVRLAGKTIAESRFRGDSDVIVTEKIPMEKLMSMASPKTVHPIEFERVGAKGRLYYAATLLYSPKLAAEEPRDEGIEIRREILALPEANTAGGKPAKAGVLKRGNIYLYRITVVNPRPRFHFLIDDALPSTMEPVQSSFATESASLDRFIREKRRGSHQYWWESGNDRYELRDDRVVITKDYLAPGIHEFYYAARAVVKGRATAPSAHAMPMYEPEVFGRTGGGIQVVK